MLYAALSFCIPERLVKNNRRMTSSSRRNMSGLAHHGGGVSEPKTFLRKCSVFYPIGSNLVFLA